MILDSAVQDGKVMQDFELESLTTVGEHSQMVKAPTVVNDSGSKDYVNFPSSTAESRMIVKLVLITQINKTPIIHILPIMLIFSHLCLFNLAARNWDVEYWQYFNWENWKSGKYSFSTVGQVRFNHDVSHFCYARLTGNFVYQALPFLDFEAHYSFVRSKSRGSTKFQNSQRLELEANPSLTLANGMTLKWRSRITLQKRQAVSQIQFYFRHRLMATIPIKNRGMLIAFNAYDEVYYDFDSNKLTQNRFVPIELEFELNKKIHLKAFVMIRNFFSFSTDTWFKSFVFGSILEF